jgi:hypothetical protein
VEIVFWERQRQDVELEKLKSQLRSKTSLLTLSQFSIPTIPSSSRDDAPLRAEVNEQ